MMVEGSSRRHSRMDGADVQLPTAVIVFQHLVAGWLWRLQQTQREHLSVLYGKRA